jgi:DNA-binding HxlR family transcriptional regulator
MDQTASVDETPGPGRRAQPDLPGRPCSIARALDLIGEKWALLAIREISFGNRRFNEIARNTGAPRDRLAARLHSLVEAGILERREYQSTPPRAEYRLTAAGRDLIPVLRALLAWGDRWVSDEPPATLMHGDHELDPVLVCRHCGAEASGRLPVRVNSPGWNLRGPVPAGDLVLGIPRRGGAFDPVLPPRQHVTWRTPPGRDQWSQREAIWLRR